MSLSGIRNTTGSIANATLPSARLLRASFEEPFEYSPAHKALTVGENHFALLGEIIILLGSV